MTEFATLSIAALFWIQRHRVRMIDAETSLYGLIIFLSLVVIAIVFKWITKSHRLKG